MVNPPIFIPSPPPPPRDCVAVDGRRYCRDEDMTAKDGAYIILSCLAMVVWLGAVVAIYERWGGRWAAVVFFGPWLLIALCLLAAS